MIEKPVFNEHRKGGSPGAPTDWDGRIAMLATLGAFLFAVAVTCYLAALRRCEPRTPTGRAFAVVGVVLALAAIGFAVQQYTFVSLVDNAVENQRTCPTVHRLAVAAVCPATLVSAWSGGSR